MADDRTALIEAENLVLRGLLAKLSPTCHYCGLEDLSRCVHGFPGCPLADDLLLGQDAAFAAWARRTTTSNGENVSSP
jgi:hypothetical protein